MAILGTLSAKSNKFYVTGAQNTKFDASLNINMQEGRNKARPSTEVGRQRIQNKKGEAAASTVDVTGESRFDTNVSATKKKPESKVQIANSTHTPRFSVTQRSAITM